MIHQFAIRFGWSIVTELFQRRGSFFNSCPSSAEVWADHYLRFGPQKLHDNHAMIQERRENNGSDWSEWLGQ
jgi:hypothetical protein